MVILYGMVMKCAFRYGNYMKGIYKPFSGENGSKFGKAFALYFNNPFPHWNKFYKFSILK